MQKLESNYNVTKYIEEHKKRGQIVKRISKYPLILDRDGQSANNEQSVHSTTAFFSSRLEKKEYLNKIKG